MLLLVTEKSWANTLSNGWHTIQRQTNYSITYAWVIRPEHQKGENDELKRPKGPQPRSRGPEGPWLLVIDINIKPKQNVKGVQKLLQTQTGANFFLSYGNVLFICWKGGRDWETVLLSHISYSFLSMLQYLGESNAEYSKLIDHQKGSRKRNNIRQIQTNQKYQIASKTFYGKKYNKSITIIWWKSPQ